MLDPAKNGINAHSALSKPRSKAEIDSLVIAEVLGKPSGNVVAVGAANEMAHDKRRPNAKKSDGQIERERDARGKSEREITVSRRQKEQAFGIGVDPSRPHRTGEIGTDHQGDEGGKRKRRPVGADVWCRFGFNSHRIGHAVER